MPSATKKYYDVEQPYGGINPRRSLPGSGWLNLIFPQSGMGVLPDITATLTDVEMPITPPSSLLDVAVAWS